MSPSRSMACLDFFLTLSSPSGHMWQKLQLTPFWQPPGFQYQAHGRHVPTICELMSFMGVFGGGCKPGGICRCGEAAGAAPPPHRPSGSQSRPWRNAGE
mmetsp:Transcript_20791/g.39630  ORF Transcript_20791/g.39630 Transcript_20791/m.39630 type:complete len:99 (+) Transcript_20791:153-449(+)